MLRYALVPLTMAWVIGCSSAQSPPPVAIPPAPPTAAPVAVPAAVPVVVPGEAATAPAPASHVWPRTYRSAGGDTLVLYQPQVDSWTDYAKIRFRAAFAITTALSGRTDYGVVAAQGDTLVDHAARTVLVTNLDVGVRFPNLAAEQAEPLKGMVKDLLPNLNYLDISLDQVLAFIKEKPRVPRVELNYDPPPIYYSEVPAIMVIYLGAPNFKPIERTKLNFAVNTNWTVIQDTATGMYYLLNEDSWLMGSDAVKGPWMQCTNLPPEFASLPATGWEDVRKHIPGKAAASAPRVIATTQPAELIVTNGPPTYSAIEGTRLMYVNNPVMPVFWDARDADFYYLSSGRWFRAKEIVGPWSAASADLPAEFAKIPPDSPVGFALHAVPNTQEAEDAILLASIPHKAQIKVQGTTVNVTYNGTPSFVPIHGTTMTYAVNTGYQVIGVSGLYYCCYNGVWFVGPAPGGPYVLCATVPQVIYTIPPTCPVYNVTYCTVYNSTPDYVVVGYTSGYSGEYVAATGALMFGAGMMVGAAMAGPCCNPCYYSYGCGACYHYGYGGYYCAGSCYGPYGGAGYRAGYNPATGNYYRAGAAYGPGGAHWGGQAYNPWTNTYAQHTGGANGYKSWGSSYVHQGDKWAEASHQSTARGGVGYASNSSGQWAEGAHSNVTNSSVAKTSGGDYYASHDGNVYKNSGDGWQKYNGDGNWSDTNWNRSTAQANYSQAKSNWQSSAASSDWSSAKSNWESDRGSSANAWSDHFNQSGLNSDAWSRNQGTNNAASSWNARNSGGGWGGGDRFVGGVRGGRGGGGFRR